MKKSQYLILTLLLFFAFLKTYSLHLDYRFPYHHDEWQHLALSIQAIEEGYNKQHNPYLDEPNFHFDLESGFHLFLASLFILTGVDPILSYQYFAAFFSVLTAFSIFVCTYKLSKNYIVGIISVMVFISLKSNVNILGKDFFTPLSMAMPFMFFFIYLFITSLKQQDQKKLGISLILLFVIFLIHPPSSVILILPMLFEIFHHRNFIKKQTKLISVLVIFSGIVFLLIWKGSIIDTIRYLTDLLFFERGWGRLEITYFLPFLYGLVNTLLALYGFFDSTKLRFFAVFSFITVALTSFFNIKGFTFLIPYSRVIHYAMLSMIPLTAIGLTKFIHSLKKYIKFKYVDYIGITTFFVIILTSKYGLDEQYKFYENPIITEEDYQSLIWINQNVGENKVVIVPYHMTSAVYPISKNQVISIVPSQMSGGFAEENLLFYNLGCESKKNIILKTKAEYILSRTKIDCGLKEIYANNNYIYQII